MAEPALRLDGRPMRVLLVNQYFHPDLAATAQLMTDLAVDLASFGAQVEVVTGRAPYVGTTLYAPEERLGEVRIVRPRSTALGRGALWKRMGDYLSFAASSFLSASALGRHDVVVTLSTPPLLSVLGATLKRMGRGKFVYWVQDLYPDVAVQMGVLGPRSPVTRSLEALAKRTLKEADAVVVLGETMAERVAKKGAPPERIFVIHNWSNAEVGSVPKAHNPFLDRHGLRGKFVVLYSGNMGRGHEFDTLLGAARALKDDPSIVFLFIGDGAHKPTVERASRELPNVKLLPYQPREELPYSLGSGDLFAITLSEGLEGLIVPSKLYGALAAGRPVLFIGPRRSETALALSRHGCGETFAHGDVDGVSRFIVELSKDPARATQLGEAGKAAFTEHYDRRIATRAFADVCLKVCQPQ